MTVQARLEGMDLHIEEAAPGPRREPVDDVPQDHAAADRCRASPPPACSRSRSRSTTSSITNFNAGQTITFPLFIYGAARQGVPPQVNVLATMLLVAAMVLMVLNVAWQRRAARRDARAMPEIELAAR